MISLDIPSYGENILLFNLIQVSLVLAHCIRKITTIQSPRVSVNCTMNSDMCLPCVVEADYTDLCLVVLIAFDGTVGDCSSGLIGNASLK